MILRKIATLQMSVSDKRKYGMEGRGALDGYAEADWWRTLNMDINFLKDDYLNDTISDFKRILTGIMKAVDILQSEIASLKSQ